jgi:hypothetical protein
MKQNENNKEIKVLRIFFYAKTQCGDIISKFGNKMASLCTAL